MTNPAQDNIIAPYITHRFEVIMTIPEPPSGVTNPVCNAAFAECNGLDMTIDVKTYRSGGENNQQFHRIGKVNYGRLTLKRGMTETLHLWRWFQATTTPGNSVKADGEITLLDSAGEPRLRFIMTGCLPVKMTGPSFTAKTSAIAMEELQLLYETLAIDTVAGSAGAGFGFSAGINAGISASASANLSVGGGASLSASASVNLNIG